MLRRATLIRDCMVRVVLEQPVHRLGELEPFEGSGIYVIYYTGDFEAYKPIAAANRNGKWEHPIYVGEATRRGARKGGVLAEGPPGKAIFERLGNHADSIRGVVSLNIKDFWGTLPRPEGFLHSALRVSADRPLQTHLEQTRGRVRQQRCWC